MNWQRIRHELTKERGPAPKRVTRWCPQCEQLVECEAGKHGPDEASTRAVSHGLMGFLTFGLSLPLSATEEALAQTVGWRCPNCKARTQAPEWAAARKAARRAAVRELETQDRRNDAHL